MSCSCDEPSILFPVPPALRASSTEATTVGAICPRCLAVEERPDAAADVPTEPDFSRISGSFPDGEAGVAFALALGLLTSLATNRAAIESLLERVERAGVDPLLALDRLCSEPTIDPTIELDRRRHQLEQVL